MGKFNKGVGYDVSRYRHSLLNYYKGKYLEAFLSKYKLEALNADENRYIFNKFWYEGKIAQWNVGGNKEVPLIYYATFTVNKRTPYDTPFTITPVLKNTESLSKVPEFKEMKVDEDCTICYVRRDHRSINEMASPLIDNIVDAEMILKVHEFAMKMPVLFKVTPETENKIRELMNRIANDNPALAVTGNEADDIITLLTGTNNFIPELYTYKNQRENELKTFLGLDNTPLEDYSRLNVDQTNANNADINVANDSTMEILNEWNERSKKVFGIDLKPIQLIKPVSSIHDDIDGKENEDDKDA